MPTTSFTTVSNGDPLNPAQVNQFAAPINALETAMDGKAAASHSHSASEINSGTIATARLGSGTADNTKFLRGDQTWAVPSGGGGGSLTDLSDVTINAPSTGQVLRKSAGDWVNSSIQASDLPAGIDATKIGAGSVSDTEFGYLDGVTSALQTQLNGKAATSHTHSGSDINIGTVAVARLGSGTPSSSNWLRGDGAWSALAAGDIPSGVDAAKIGAGSVSNTEFGYLDGVTSGIQGQLDGKAATSHTHSASDINSGTIATARLGSGTADNTKFLRGDQTWAVPSGGGGGAQLAIFRRVTSDQGSISGSYAVDYLQYNSEVMDEGNHWTNSGDDYTCATTGTYIISQRFFEGGTGLNYFSLEINGTEQPGLFLPSTAYDQVYWVAKLTAGDVLRFRVISSPAWTMKYTDGASRVGVNQVTLLKVA